MSIASWRALAHVSPPPVSHEQVAILAWLASLFIDFPPFSLVFPCERGAPRHLRTSRPPPRPPFFSRGSREHRHLAHIGAARTTLGCGAHGARQGGNRRNGRASALNPGAPGARGRRNGRNGRASALNPGAPGARGRRNERNGRN